MQSLFSSSLSASAATRLRSAYALKAMLRDSLNLNLNTPSLEDDAQPETMASSKVPESPFADESELFSLQWPCVGEDIDLDDYAPPRPRQRQDSAASTATLKSGPEESNTQVSESSPKKRSKRSASKHRVVSSGGKRSLKRSHSSRNLRPNEEFHVEKQGTDDSEPDWSEDIPGLNFTASETADGVTSLNFQRSPPTAVEVKQLAELNEFIAQEDDHAKMLDGLYNTVVCGIKVRQRFDVSINFKTKHVELWDVVNFKKVHTVEGIVYVKDALPYAPGQLLEQPIQSVSLEWRTVESDCKKPRITDKVLYETCLGEEPKNSRYNIHELSVARGLYTGKKWEWVAPGAPGTSRGGGWVMRFWVPVPLSLLKDRAGGVASFVHASVTLIDDDQDDLITTHAQTTVTLESLRSGRDMPVFSRL